MKLQDLVTADSVIVELTSNDRGGVIRELVEQLAQAERIETEATESIIKSILARERTRGTTGFGKGVAAPHAKVEGLPAVVAAVGRSSKGVDFGSLDGQPVFGIFLILSPAEDAEQHLRAMELVFKHLQQERFRKFLRQADTVEQIMDLLQEADEKETVG